MSIYKKSPAGKQGLAVASGHIKYTKLFRLSKRLLRFFALKEQLNKSQHAECESNGLMLLSNNELLNRISRSKDTKKRCSESLIGLPEDVISEAHKLYILEAERRGLINE